MAQPVRKDKELLVQLGARIKKIREAKGIPHEKIDESLRTNMYRYEIGESNLTISILALICKYLQVPLSEMLEGLESNLPINE